MSSSLAHLTDSNAVNGLYAAEQGKKWRLLSNDGTHPIDAQDEPSIVYEPDDSTKQLIQKFYSALEERVNQNDNIEELPFFADLLLLNKDELNAMPSVGDVTEGLCRIATHFISRHQIIQARANAFLRCKIAGAEVTVTEGTLLCLSEQVVERDQILLSSATTAQPQLSSPRSADTPNEGISSPGGSRNIASPPTGSLLRSQSVNQQHIESYAAHVFVMEDETLHAILNFLPGIFNDDNCLCRNGLSEKDLERLHELWEFFDNDMDGIVSRNDILEGLSNIAKHFIANDEITQLITNSYIQKKIRRAGLAIDRSSKKRSCRSQDSSPLNKSKQRKSDKTSTITFKKGDKAIFTDQEGNRHVAKVLRKSQRPMAGKPAYYVELHGIKLYVSLSRLSNPQSGDEIMEVEQQQNSINQIVGLGEGPEPHQEYHLITQLSYLQLPENSETTDGDHMSVTEYIDSAPPLQKVKSKSVHDALSATHPPSSNTSTSRSIFGYLRSGLAAVSKGTLRISPVNPATSKSAEKMQVDSTNSTNEAMKPQLARSSSQPSTPNGSYTPRQSGRFHPGTVVPMDEDNQRHQHFDQQPALSNIVDAVLVMDDDADSVYGGDSSVVFKDQDCRGNADKLSVDDTIPFAEEKVFNATPRDDSSLRSNDCGDSLQQRGAPAEVVPLTAEEQTQQRLNHAEYILKIDAKILSIVRRKTGPELLITAPLIPKPKKVEPYPIYFNRGKNGFFEFNQVDFGVHFLPFLDNLIPVDDRNAKECHDCIKETNRCFFLHFGVAMGIHPYALQHCFRKAAVQLLQHPENEMTIFFGEALESLLLRNDFVDAQVLSAIWPIEFDRFKILIVRVDQNGRIESFNTFRSEVGPVDEFGEWAGEELLFTLQWNHFTVLKPKSEQLTKPITAVLAAASMIGILPLEFIVSVPSESSQRFRVMEPQVVEDAHDSKAEGESKGIFK